MTNTYIDLHRQFRPLHREQQAAEDYEAQIVFGISEPLGWDSIFEMWRVVILAEAGSGKTEEIKQATRRLRQRDRQSFFLRLEYLTDEIEDAFEGRDLGTHEEFGDWLASDRVAWIFLDSVDEARLQSPRDFEKALRKLSRRLGSACQRAHIVITSRITEWQARSDGELVEQWLPFKPPSVAKASDAEETAEDMDGVKDRPLKMMSEDHLEEEDAAPDQEPDDSELSVLSLAPLDEEQIRKFAATRGVADVDNFAEAIQRSEAYVYASRPKDLDDLVAFWKSHGKLGSRRELLEESIATHLTEHDPARAQVHPLPMSRARSGVKTIAAAMIFSKKTRIRTPGSTDEIEGLDLSQLLPEWNEAELATLLSRPVFDEAIYGSVRFHHREVREYLAAEWLGDLLKQDRSRVSVEALLFKNQYGVEVVTPTARPILPWLSLMDDRVRNRTITIAPDLLLSGGDPSQLPLEYRERLLRKVCEELVEDGRAAMSFDLLAVQRFSLPDMEDVVLELFETYQSSQDVRQLLLRMIWQGKLTGCRKHADRCARDSSADNYTRINGIRALGAVGTPAQKLALVESFASETPLAPHQVYAELVETFGGTELPITAIIDYLEATEPPAEYSHDHLEYALTQLARHLDEDRVFEFASKLGRLLKRPPHLERRHVEMSVRYQWLSSAVAHACINLVERRSPKALSPEILSLMSLVKKSSAYGGRVLPLDELKAVTIWQELNLALFWNDVAEARADREREGPIRYYFQARSYDELWSFAPDDFERVLAEIPRRGGDDALVAISLCFAIYRDAERPRKWREQMKRAVAQDPDQKKFLADLLTPPPLSDEMRRYNARNRQFRRRQKAREAQWVKNRAEWKKVVLSDIDRLRDLSPASDGTIWRTQDYLMRQVQEADKKNSSTKWAHANWKSLIPEFGVEVAKAYRDGAIAYWRAYLPKVRSEGVKNLRSVPLSVVFGLSGLEMEATSNKNWVAQIDEKEAERATRYALWEMNGFPKWLKQLHSKFPRVVEDRILDEIKWELSLTSEKSSDTYVLSDVIWHGDWLKPRIARPLFDLIKKRTEIKASDLEHCLSIVREGQDISTEELTSLAAAGVRANDDALIRSLWFAFWVSVEPETGIAALEDHLAQLNNACEADEIAMHFSVKLAGKPRQRISKEGDSEYSAVQLRQLCLLLNRHIRPTEDIDRAGTGVYSPGLRDNAQEARDGLHSQLRQMPGKESYLALLEISEQYPVEDARAWIRHQAIIRAQNDADLPPWSEKDIVDFATNLEKPPTNNAELFQLTLQRLGDLKSWMEDGDDSPADIIKLADDETLHRNFIGGWLRNFARGRYFIPQEEEYADAKRSDLRIHGNGVDAPVPVELKVAEKWSGTDLFERLENQLCNDYLRDTRSRTGVFLLICRDAMRKWDLPATRQRVGFADLVSALQSHANDFTRSRTDIDAVKVVGIELFARKLPRRNLA